MTESVQIVISGRVQGVYFRAFTQKQAKKLNLTGYAKNLSNGDVEIIACGEKSQLEKLVQWCHKGPIMAKVNSVQTRPLTDARSYQGFDIL
ncbi:acylphosphatase [Methylomarinum sp. Ch1-1]|uniref:Acylphosphatase n=1 Tax=Methylomarinum roseum TaxID=3067653 RepID=A0AAU7NY12_9GAMM|nr:acylphosphatase [Methylomarinum sp. Ch1-1]MDP4522047.1 acylphosphatase [Methylomarinum sp. Ch1-1]